MLLTISLMLMLSGEPKLEPEPPKQVVEQTEVKELVKPTDKESLKGYAEVVAKINYINVDRFIKTINCESGFNPKAYNPNDKHRHSIGSHGIAQFSMETYNHYAKLAGIGGDPYNPYDAIDVMVYMWKNGGQKHWSCY